MGADTTDVTDPETETDTDHDLTTKTEVDEGPRTLSIGRILAWLVGAFSVLTGLAGLFTTPVMGVTFLVAGVFAMPPTRSMIEDEANVEMSRWFIALGYLAILFIGSGIYGAM